MEEKNIKIRSFFWNTIGAGFNAIQSAIFLFISSRLFDLETSGSITFAFTISNLLLTASKYGLRNYQATDKENKYSFSSYYYTRVITTSISVLFLLLFLAAYYFSGQYNIKKVLIVFLITMLKLTETIEDVVIGSLQKKGRLDIGSKMFTIHIISSTVVFIIVSFIQKNIIIAIASCFSVALIISLYFVVTYIKKEHIKLELNKSRIKQLLLEGLPLCISSVIYIYLGNSPKFLSETFLSEYDQVIVGYLMLPMFVVLLISNFIVLPLIKPLADALHNNRKLFVDMIRKQSAIIIVVSFIIMVVGLFFLIPLLSTIYLIDLSAYQLEFVLLEIGVTMYTLSYYYSVVLTTMRIQKHILISYMFGLFTIFFICKPLVIGHGIRGCSLVYIVSNVITLIYFALVVKKSLKYEIAEK